MPLTFSGRGIRSVFPWKVFANQQITVLGMSRFGLPVSATPEVNVPNHFDKDNSGSIEAEPRIRAMEIRRINSQGGRKGFVLSIVVACVEATPVIPSLSHL